MQSLCHASESIRHTLPRHWVWVPFRPCTTRTNAKYMGISTGYGVLVYVVEIFGFLVLSPWDGGEVCTRSGGVWVVGYFDFLGRGITGLFVIGWGSQCHVPSCAFTLWNLNCLLRLNGNPYGWKLMEICMSADCKVFGGGGLSSNRLRKRHLTVHLSAGAMLSARSMSVATSKFLNLILSKKISLTMQETLASWIGK